MSLHFEILAPDLADHSKDHTFLFELVDLYLSLKSALSLMFGLCCLGFASLMPKSWPFPVD